MRALLDKIRNEPVLVTAFVTALIALFVAFGLDLSDTQTAAILGVVGAVLALVARSRVTPV
jgi:hypothetical protein